jgi:hypothetical protein
MKLEMQLANAAPLIPNLGIRAYNSSMFIIEIAISAKDPKRYCFEVKMIAVFVPVIRLKRALKLKI